MERKCGDKRDKIEASTIKIYHVDFRVGQKYNLYCIERYKMYEPWIKAEKSATKFEGELIDMCRGNI